MLGPPCTCQYRLLGGHATGPAAQHVVRTSTVAHPRRIAIQECTLVVWL